MRLPGPWGFRLAPKARQSQIMLRLTTTLMICAAGTPPIDRRDEIRHDVADGDHRRAEYDHHRIAGRAGAEARIAQGAARFVSDRACGEDADGELIEARSQEQKTRRKVAPSAASSLWLSRGYYATTRISQIVFSKPS